MSFAEAERGVQLQRLAAEARSSGVPLILLEADGGKVRSGKLAPCEQGDPGYGKKTAKRSLPVRKRLVSWREVITMDARLPGENEASALDVLVLVDQPLRNVSRRPAPTAGRIPNHPSGDACDQIGRSDCAGGPSARRVISTDTHVPWRA